MAELICNLPTRWDLEGDATFDQILDVQSPVGDLVLAEVLGHRRDRGPRRWHHLDARWDRFPGVVVHIDGDEADLWQRERRGGVRDVELHAAHRIGEGKMWVIRSPDETIRHGVHERLHHRRRAFECRRDSKAVRRGELQPAAPVIGKLDHFAEKALADFRAGKTRPL